MPNRSIPDTPVIPVLNYPDLAAAVRWLHDAFGFRARLRIGDHRVQMEIDGGGAMVAKQGDHTSGAGPHPTHSTMVRVSDVDAHHARARQAGAHITNPPQTYPFGERQYGVVDIGGHAWTFTQTVADADPASWGGEMIVNA